MLLAYFTHSLTHAPSLLYCIHFILTSLCIGEIAAGPGRSGKNSCWFHAVQLLAATSLGHYWPRSLGIPWHLPPCMSSTSWIFPHFQDVSLSQDVHLAFWAAKPPVFLSSLCAEVQCVISILIDSSDSCFCVNWRIQDISLFAACTMHRQQVADLSLRVQNFSFGQPPSLICAHNYLPPFSIHNLSWFLYTTALSSTD